MFLRLVVLARIVSGISARRGSSYGEIFEGLVLAKYAGFTEQEVKSLCEH